VPAGEGADAGGVGIQFLEEGINGGVFLWQRGIDEPLDALTNRFNDAFGGVEFGSSGLWGGWRISTRSWGWLVSV
jgi:hypothetical protein